MEIINKLLELISAHSAMILGVLLGLSEMLALIPGIKSNSIFQLIVSAIKKLSGSSDPVK